MTAADLLVFVLCLFVGYWLVSKLLDRSGSRKPDADDSRAGARPPPASPQSGPAGHGEYLPRDAHIDARATLSNWYRILGVRETAGKLEIEAACKRRMALYPPSALALMAPERRAAAVQNMRQIQSAYELGMRRFRD
jgi:DnaJ-domain-containing protein 1